MSNVRRFHGAGVGGRTGMRISDGAFDLDDFMAAGRKAMNPTYAAPLDKLMEDESSLMDNRASSSMIIANSPGPSPRSTIRRSQAPSSSSPFLSSPGTARNVPSSAKSNRTASPLESIRLQIMSEENIGSSSISSPTKDRGLLKRKMLTTGLDARRKAQEVSEQAHPTARQSSSHSSNINEPDGTVDEQDVNDDAASLASAIEDEAEKVSASSVQRISPPVFNNHSRQSIDADAISAPVKDKKSSQQGPQTTKKILAKAAIVKRRPPPLKEKNGVATQAPSQPGRASEGATDIKGKQRAFKIFDNANDTGDTKGSRAVIEKIPSSYHRQLSADVIEGQEDAIRRGVRYRYKPLEYWRGEKARFGRPSLPKEKEQEVGDETIDGDAFEDHFAGAIPPVAVLKEIIRMPREEGEGTFSGMRIRKERSKDSERPNNVKKARPAKSEKSNVVETDPMQPTRHAEEGWDKDTEMKATVWDAANDCEAEMQVACTSSQVRTRLAINSTFGFEKVFVVDHAMATGILSILVDGQKPLKNSKDNNYTFVVLEGAVKVHLYNTSFIIAPHGMFFVPRGNDYSIENVSKRVAKVAFTQCRSA